MQAQEEKLRQNLEELEATQEDMNAAEIRGSLFGPDFGFNLFTTFLPFFVFALITILIFRGGKKDFKPNVRS